MNGFYPAETKVVMMLQDPANTTNLNSNGFALDDVVCSTTKLVFEHANYELNLLDHYAANDTGLALSETELDGLKSTCSLRGWIEQSIY